MSSDGSAGRRDGFDRWVASMKREQEPVQVKSASLKEMDKLELDLDENATHVHRIPKDLIHRMREQRAEERKAAAKQAPAAQAPREAVVAARAPAPSPAFEAQVQNAFGASEDDDDGALGGVSDDRTAVFRPPPELLARAKRMKPPSKPNPQSDVPTKPPPVAGDEAALSVPGAAKVPGFEPAAARSAHTSSVPARAPFSSSVPASAKTPGFDAPSASGFSLHHEARAAAPAVDGSSSAAFAEQPISSPEIERSAVFAHQEPTSGVMSLGVPEEPLGAFESSQVVSLTSEEPVRPIVNDALLLAVAPPARESQATEATPESDEEPPAPTTTSPFVRSEPSVPPATVQSSSPRLFVWAVLLLAAAALVYFRRHHGF
jgi:hypothetical protein